MKANTAKSGIRSFIEREANLQSSMITPVLYFLFFREQRKAYYVNGKESSFIEEQGAEMI